MIVVLCCLGCRDSLTVDKTSFVHPSAVRIAEPWISREPEDWPQIVLTNHAEFHGHTPLDGASGFLIRTEDDRVFAATARHLIGLEGGVEPGI